MSQSSEQTVQSVRALIEEWCNRRCLKALHHILDGYLALNGLTDGWGQLRLALENVRAFARHELTPEELEKVDDLIRDLDRMLRAKP